MFLSNFCASSTIIICLFDLVFVCSLICELFPLVCFILTGLLQVYLIAILILLATSSNDKATSASYNQKFFYYIFSRFYLVIYTCISLIFWLKQVLRIEHEVLVNPS